MSDRKSRLRLYFKYLVIDILVAAVVSILIITYVASAYEIEGDSMLAVLHDKERIIISKWSTRNGNIGRGDIVVLRNPDETGRTIIKRIVGLPCETVEIKKGDVYINGNLLDEPYLTQGKDVIFRSINMAPLMIPLGHYFVLGDNRTISQDSRYFGSIPKNFIYGKTIFRYWPISKIGKVE
jgi:signal peptidase I